MKRISKLQIGRFITQIIFLILFPGLFTITFGEIKQVYTMILNGNLNFVSALPMFIEVLILIPLTMLLGRFFCGWMCAFGTFNDILYIVSRKVFKVKYRVSEKADSVLKYLKYVILIFIAAVIWTFGTTIFQGSSPWDAFAQMTNFSEAISTYAVGCIILAFIAVGAMFIERFFCRYLCPLGAIFAITSKIRIFNIDKPRDKCGQCRACTNNCAMGISLYKGDKVKSGECINCFKCVTICPRKNAQADIAGEYINPALGSAAAVAAFASMYSVGSLFTNGANSSLANINTNQNKVLAASQGGTYKDGTYTGTGNGYRPGLEVEVTIKNNKITNVEIGSNNETPRFASQPFSIIPQEIIAAQSTDVDTVSGATRTSNGIIMAVEDALNQAQGISSSSNSSNSAEEDNSSSNSNDGTNDNSSNYDNDENSSQTWGRHSGEGNRDKGLRDGYNNDDNDAAAPFNSNDNSSDSDTDSSSSNSNSNSSTSSSQQITYKDGTYTGTGNGYRSGLEVSVTVKDNKITDIQIGSNNETPRFASQPFSVIPQEIIQAQSTNVNTVSGATRTSNGIIMAVEDALSQAKQEV